MPSCPISSTWHFLLGGSLWLVAGCAADRAEINRTLMADHTPAAHTRAPEAGYQVRCPDRLAITVPGCPGWSGPRMVHADGRVVFDDGTSLLVDGLTPPEISAQLARVTHLSSRQIVVRVVDYRSQELFLLSPGSEVQQVVAYHGPETVVDLLQRLGGFPVDAEVHEIRIVRPHVADGKPPEVFTIDLHAILSDHDQQTNIRLEPSDQIHLAANRGCRVACLLPPWLRSLTGHPDGKQPPAPSRSP
jgi:protein involved in polysaccharide export with SLBB domain